MTLLNTIQPVHPSTRHNSGWRPRRKVKHWTPKGDCKVTGNKERNKKMTRTKTKFTKKLKSSSISYNKRL